MANYAHDNDLVDKPGWKQLRRYVNNTNNMNHLLKASKAKQQRNIFEIKFGMKIPCDHREAIMFDADNGNTNWKGTEILVLKIIYNFDPFESLGPVKKSCIPTDHTKIQVHLIYDYKQYGRYKAHMVDSSNMDGPNIYTYYYIVISLCSIHTVVFLAELNNTETHTGEISKSYLTARTTEKIVLNAGPEFAPFVHAVQLLLIKTALDGLNSYGARFHSQLSYDLIDICFFPYMGWCDIWMRNEVDY